jgi:hypothetical protein
LNGSKPLQKFKVIHGLLAEGLSPNHKPSAMKLNTSSYRSPNVPLPTALPLIVHRVREVWAGTRRGAQGTGAARIIYIDGDRALSSNALTAEGSSLGDGVISSNPTSGADRIIRKVHKYMELQKIAAYEKSGSIAESHAHTI